MLFFAALAAVVFFVVLHEIAWRAVMLALRVGPAMPSKFTASRAWTRSQAFRSRLARRYPALVAFVANRVDPHRPTGLPLTLVIIAAAYLAALFSGLTEDILAAEGISLIDNAVNAAFGPWRVEPLVSASLWITALGSSPSVISAVIIATAFLWSERRLHIIVPLWVTSFSALGTTSLGKFLIGRHRPEMTIDVTAMYSSFPSGHATAAMAVYGFIAYALARALPGVRERFEVAYWIAVLILLIGFSRIVLGVHYLTDVIGGFLVGGFWLLIGLTIAEWRGARASAMPHGRDESIQAQSPPRDGGP